MIMKNNIGSLFKKICLIFLLLCGVYYLTLVLGYIIPDSFLVDNWMESVNVINDLEEKRWTVMTGFEGTKLDTFTDNLIFQKLQNSDNIPAFRVAMWNSGYTRYWMGIVPFVRFALVFMNYSTMRYLNIFIIFSLFVLVFSFIHKQLGILHGITLSITLFLINFWIFPLSFQYSPVYIILMIAILIILYLNKKDKLSLNNIILLFFIIGSVTNYFDLLTAPLLTFGLPFIIYYILVNHENIQSFKINFLSFVILGISWLSGYALTWIANWAISTIVLNENIFANAINQMGVRTGGGELMSFSNILTRLFSITLPRPARFILLVILLVWFGFFIKYHRNIKELINLTPILLTIFLPIVWIFIMRNHSQHHDYFVYRNLAITIYGILSWLILSLVNPVRNNKLNLRE